ncbi:aminodeoxychorismate synthase, component I [Halovivax gelatinilyticus]|uniref:aminodeoxychorismate synthase, component I n=1 Tax=Halovivax gelatinilyticus TaxID=2961597 RepID=UPI0020CA4D99|nr:aminodeoxychorismate synthase, component I [Halovivax gelatinilyticus]
MNEPRTVTTVEDVESAVAAVDHGTRIPVEVRLTVDDPFAAYRRARDGPGGAFLETTGGQSGWGYFGADPVERLTVSSDAVLRSHATHGSPTIAALEGVLAGESIVHGRSNGDEPVPYPCGAIGWLSYDVARELETLPETAVDDRRLPRLELAVFDRLAAWEEPTDGPVTLRITACPKVAVNDGTPDKAVARDVYERGRERALDLARAIRTGEPTIGPPPVDAADATFESTCGREAFADRVRRVKRYVRDGDTFQANISQRLAAPAAVHPVAAYDALRRVNPAPYSALVEFPSADLVSASPELLLERTGDLVRTEPIAGTRPRGTTPAADEEYAEELRTDEKERAEHAMLVDLERNDLGKVCAYGSVDVEEYRRIDRYSEVMHLVSDVRGRLREDASLGDAIAATFPGGTITGAPKPRTMEIIDELEAVQRGPYTGSIGIFGFDGNATLNIVIRTLVRQAEAYHLRVGAGIVHDSVPEREYDETLDKARALVTAIDAALGERAEFAVEATEEAPERGEPR